MIVYCSCGKENNIGDSYYKRYYGQHKEFVCGTCRHSGTRNPFYGKKHTEETKKKIGQHNEIFSGTKNPFYGKKHTEETKRILKEKCSQSGVINPFYGKKHTKETRNKISASNKEFFKNNPERKDEIRKTILNRISKNKFRMTNPERSINDLLLTWNIKFKYNFILNNKFQYDFLIYPNTIIEVQGDYWHGNPKIYGDDKRPLNERQIFKMERDGLKREYAEQCGYTVHYIWELDIKNKNYESIICLRNLN